jgi:hypothetical protein
MRPRRRRHIRGDRSLFGGVVLRFRCDRWSLLTVSSTIQAVRKPLRGDSCHVRRSQPVRLHSARSCTPALPAVLRLFQAWHDGASRRCTNAALPDTLHDALQGSIWAACDVHGYVDACAALPLRVAAIHNPEVS